MEQSNNTAIFSPLSTALCLIRDGMTSKKEVRAMMGLSPVLMLSLMEEAEAQAYITCLGDLVVITAAGRQAVSHIQLVRNVGNNVLERWAAPDPAGPKRVA